MSNKVWHLVATLAVVAGVPGLSFAAPTFVQSNLPSIPSGFSSIPVAIDFESLTTSNTPITNQFASQGVTFSGGLFSGNSANGAPQLDPSGHVVAENFLLPLSIPQNPITISLNFARTQVGFDLSGFLFGAVHVTTFLNGVPTGSKTILGGLFGPFFPLGHGIFLGITDPNGIDQIQLTSTLGFLPNALFLDDIRLGSRVPEPTSLAVWAMLGLSGAGWWRRRQSSNQLVS
jgi:MYXO-CTERM domain-containing protein